MIIQEGENQSYAQQAAKHKAHQMKPNTSTSLSHTSLLGDPQKESGRKRGDGQPPPLDQGGVIDPGQPFFFLKAGGHGRGTTQTREKTPTLGPTRVEQITAPDPPTPHACFQLHLGVGKAR